MKGVGRALRCLRGVCRGHGRGSGRRGRGPGELGGLCNDSSVKARDSGRTENLNSSATAKKPKQTRTGNDRPFHAEHTRPRWLSEQGRPAGEGTQNSNPEKAVPREKEDGCSVVSVDLRLTLRPQEEHLREETHRHIPFVNLDAKTLREILAEWN